MAPFPHPLIGRVEDWRAGLGRSLGSLLSRPFVCECPTISTDATFPVPLHVARSVRISRTARPHLLHANAYGTYPAGADFRPVASHSIGVKQPSSVVQATAYSIVPSRSPFVSEQVLRTTGRFSLRLDV